MLSKAWSSAFVITCYCGTVFSVVSYSRLHCVLLLTVALTALSLDKMINGEASPEEQKQEVEREKVVEETSVGENHR